MGGNLVAQTVTWTGGGGNNRWGTGNNWNPTGIPNASKDALFDNSSMVTLPTTIELRRDRNINSLTFNTGDALSLVDGTGSRTLSLMSGAITRTVASSGSQSLAFSILDIQNANANFTIDGSGAFTIASVIDDGGNGSSAAKNGAGTLILSATNTFAGDLTVNAGTLGFGNNAAAGTGTLILAGGTIYADSAAQSLNNTVTVSGNFAVGGTNNLTLSGATALGAATRTVTVDNTGLTTFSGVISSGTAGLTKAGAGTLVLSGTNTYSGSTTVNGGNLRISADANLGAAPGAPTAGKLVLNGGTLETSSTFTLNSNRGVTVNAGGGAIDVNAGTTLTYNGILAGAGPLNKIDTGTLVLGGATTNTHTGNINVNAGTLQIAKTVANTAIGDTAAVTVASGASLTFSGGVGETIGSLAGGGTVNNSNAAAMTITTGGNNTSTDFSGVIQNTGGNLSLVKTGTGTQTLSGATANTFAGTVKINDGTLNLNKTAGVNALGTGAVTVGDGIGAASSANLVLLASNQMPATATVTLNSDGRLALNNFSQSIATLAGTGLVDLSTSGYLTVGANNASSAFGGSITGAGTLEKAGTGILTFNSAISYTGSLKLSGGTLQLNGVNATIGTLNITGNSIIDFAGSAARLNLTNLTISAGVTLTVANWANATDFFFATNWTGATFDLAGSAPMNQVAFNGFTANNTKWQSYDNQVTPVPEPSSYGAMLLGALAALFAWRRLRRAGAR